MKKCLSLALVLMILVCGITAIPTTADQSAPEPNGFRLKIDENGAISNGVESIVYILSEINGAPTVSDDSESGNKYLNIRKAEDKALEVSMKNEAVAGTQAGIFWKYYWNATDESKNFDLSFTWEFLVRVPEMNPTAGDYVNMFGYRAGDGGFGFRLGNTTGQFVVGHGRSGNNYSGTGLIKLDFPMEANEWYHCILTYDHSSKTLNAYVNGEPVADDTGATDIAVDWLIPTNYLWNKRGMGIGTAPEYSGVTRDSDIGIFNFSEYSVDSDQANLLWKQADDQWQLTETQPVTEETPAAPVDNGFVLKIDDNGQVSNGVESNVYILSELNGVPTIGVDSLSGNKYLSVTKSENKALEISTRNEAVAGTLAGIFWKYYWNATDATKNYDLSFTWEFLVRVPEMNPTQGDYANLFGYRAGEGGFGLMLGDSSGQFRIGYGRSGNNYNGTGLIKLDFPMEANKWYHCVLTYDHATKTINAYVNGEAIKDSSGATDVTVDWIVPTNYLWNKRGMGIGTAPEYSDVRFSSDIGIYNFAEYSVDASEAASLWTNVEEEWKLNYVPPVTSDEPVTTDEPTTTDIPIATDEPVVTDEPAVTPGTVEPQPSTGDTGIIVACIAIVLCVGIVLLLRKKKIAE